MGFAISSALFRGPAAWRGADLAPTAWTHALDGEERAGWGRLLAGAPLDGALARAVDGWRAELADGRGFLLVRGLDVEGHAPETVSAAYRAIGRRLGQLTSQNRAGELLTHIRDEGADPDDPRTRLYRTNAGCGFHTDGADIISLLCLARARTGGVSRIVSGASVVDAVRRASPELLPVLFEDFPFHYDEPGMGAPRCFLRPICSVRGGRLCVFFVPWYIRRSQALADAPRLTAAQRRAVDTLEAAAEDPALPIAMDFAPGDLQLVKNASVLHARTPFEDDGAQRRHLLRLWITAPDFVDGDPDLRRGIAPRSPSP